MTEEKRIGRFSVFFGGIGPKVGPLSGKWHGEVKPKNDGKEIVSLSSAAVHSSNEMTLIFFNFSPQKNFFISRLRVLRHPSPSSPSPPLPHTPLATLLAPLLPFPSLSPGSRTKTVSCVRVSCAIRVGVDVDVVVRKGWGGG